MPARKHQALRKASCLQIQQEKYKDKETKRSEELHLEGILREVSKHQEHFLIKAACAELLKHRERATQ